MKLRNGSEVSHNYLYLSLFVVSLLCIFTTYKYCKYKLQQEISRICDEKIDEFEKKIVVKYDIMTYWNQEENDLQPPTNVIYLDDTPVTVTDTDEFDVDWDKASWSDLDDTFVDNTRVDNKKPLQRSSKLERKQKKI